MGDIRSPSQKRSDDKMWRWSTSRCTRILKKKKILGANISVAVTKGVNLVDHLPLNFYSTNLIDFFCIFLRGLRKCRSAQFPGEIFFSPSPGLWDEGRKSGLRKLACGPTRS